MDTRDTQTSEHRDPFDELEQLTGYIEAHYPAPDFTPPWSGGSGDPDPADRWIGRLPDRITHAAMLQLGTEVDQSMPGPAFAQGVDVIEAAEVGGAVMRPTRPTGRWAVSLHSGGWWRGAGDALEFQWRPEVAAAAELSGTTVLDLDYPLLPRTDLPGVVKALDRGVEWVRGQTSGPVAVWGYSSGGALATLASHADVLILTFPDLDSVAKLPEHLRRGVSVPPVAEWPRALVQVAVRDEIAARPRNVEAEEYVSTHRISTPTVARERVRAVAGFLRAL